MDVLPSVPLPTFGGKQLWGDVFLYAGFRIQQNVFTRHHRLLGPGDVRLAAGSYDHCHSRFERLADQRAAVPQSDHWVLLLHGIFRSKDSFGPMTRALTAAGYEAHGVNYPSTRQGLNDHADQVELLLERARDVSTVSFVTHSMGGIVARVLLGRPDRPWRKRIAVNRVVMIAVPNQGSELATRLDQVTPFRAVAGPSLPELQPHRRDAIPVPDVPFGIVAGSRGDGQGYNPLLPGDDDMTVSVESTRLPGAEDFLEVRGIHTFVMVQPDVVEATVRYLRTGRFREVSETPGSG
ncbi:MAG: alpha/beta fold hydrolase [Myxococcota bacterium]